MQHIVVFSHGFGVRKDDRGLFTDIAQSFPDITSVLFDYNQFDASTNTITVAPLDKQASMLQERVATILHDNPHATVDMVCHSQGCLVAAMSEVIGVRRTIMLAPPTEISTEGMAATFSRTGAAFNIVGDSLIPRTDGTTTVVKTDYWKSLEDIEPISLYNRFAEHTDLTIIAAREDEILDKVDFTGLSKNITFEEMAAGHNFEGTARHSLVMRLADTLVIDSDNIYGRP